jgi:hypothetical protein
MVKMIKYLRTRLIMSVACIFVCSANIVKADVGDQLDALIATGAFTYEPYANVTLSQVGRHAFSFSRVRFTVPTENINLVQWTPPSINTSCNSISLNLGNFSFISLDEAISALRSIAAQSLTYGFGQAVQALCQPCWAGMKDLQKVLQTFNQSAKNTCYWSEQLTAELTPMFGDAGDEHFEDYMCRQIGNQFGDDPLTCKQITESISETTASWIADLEAAGIDSEAAFVEGNSVYQAFIQVVGNEASFESVIPSATSSIFFGGSPNAAEVAMTFFGTSVVGQIQATVKSNDGLLLPLINEDQYDKIMTTDFTSCATDDKTDCLQFYRCNAGLSDNGRACMAPSPTNATNFFEPDPVCDALLVGKKSIENYITCHVDTLLIMMKQGALGVGGSNLSKTQLMLLAHLSRAEQAAFYLGEPGDRETLSIIAVTHLSKFVSTSLLHDYLSSVLQSTNRILADAKEIDNLEVQLSGVYNTMTLMGKYISKLSTEKADRLAKMRDNETWQTTVAKYSKSTAAIVADLNKAQR